MSRPPPYFTLDRASLFSGEELLQDHTPACDAKDSNSSAVYRLRQELWAKDRQISDLHDLIAEHVLPLKHSIEQLLKKQVISPDFGALLALQANIIDGLLKAHQQGPSEPRRASLPSKNSLLTSSLFNPEQRITNMGYCQTSPTVDYLQQQTSETLKATVQGSLDEFSPTLMRRIGPFSEIVSGDKTAVSHQEHLLRGIPDTNSFKKESKGRIDPQLGLEVSLLASKQVLPTKLRMPDHLASHSAGGMHSQRNVANRRESIDAYSVVVSHLTVPPNKDGSKRTVAHPVEVAQEPGSKKPVPNQMWNATEVAPSQPQNVFLETEQSARTVHPQLINCDANQITSFRGSPTQLLPKRDERSLLSRFADKERVSEGSDVRIPSPERESSDEILSRYIPSHKHIPNDNNHDPSKTPMSRVSRNNDLQKTYQNRANSESESSTEKPPWVQRDYAGGQAGRVRSKAERSSMTNSPKQKRTHGRRLSQMAPSQSPKIVIASDIFKTAENFLHLSRAMDPNCKEKSGFSIFSNKNDSLQKMESQKAKRSLLKPTKKETPTESEVKVKNPKRIAFNTEAQSAGWLQGQKQAFVDDPQSSQHLGAAHYRRVSRTQLKKSIPWAKPQTHQSSDFTKLSFHWRRSSEHAVTLGMGHSPLWPSNFRPFLELEPAGDPLARLKVPAFGKTTRLLN